MKIALSFWFNSLLVLFWPNDTLTSDEECYRLWNKGTGYYEIEKYRQSYDTLRTYVESCAPGQTNFFLGVFNDIGAAAQFMDPAMYHPQNMVEAREWLKKVLYYRKDTGYYCADVSAIFLTSTYWEGRGRDINANLALLKYIVDNNRCPGIIPEIFGDSTWQKARQSQYKLWEDTVKDPIATPLDTTLPSLEEIGLGILRGDPASTPSEPSVSKRSIAAATALPNPVGDYVNVRVNLESSSFLRIDIFDILGKSKYGEGMGFHSPGGQDFLINCKDWDSGPYYIRVSTTSGEVVTIPIVK